MTAERLRQLANTVRDVANHLRDPNGMKLSECQDILHEVADELWKEATVQGEKQ